MLLSSQGCPFQCPLHWPLDLVVFQRGQVRVNSRHALSCPVKPCHGASSAMSRVTQPCAAKGRPLTKSPGRPQGATTLMSPLAPRHRAQAGKRSQARQSQASVAIPPFRHSSFQHKSLVESNDASALDLCCASTCTTYCHNCRSHSPRTLHPPSSKYVAHCLLI